MATTDGRNAPVNAHDLIVRGLALGLRDQAERIRRSATTEPHRAVGAIAEAQSTLEILEQFVRSVLAHDDTDDEPAEAPAPTGMYL